MNDREQPTPDDELGRLQNALLRWSVRQQGVYHLHEAQDDSKLRSFTVLINPSRHYRDLVKAEFGGAPVEPEERIAWATMPILAFKSLPKNWSLYISCLYQVVQKIVGSRHPHQHLNRSLNPRLAKGCCCYETPTSNYRRCQHPKSASCGLGYGEAPNRCTCAGEQHSSNEVHVSRGRCASSSRAK